MMILRETLSFPVTRKDREEDVLFVEYKVYYIKNELSEEQLDIIIDKDDLRDFEIWTDTTLDQAQSLVVDKIEKIVDTKQFYGYLPKTYYRIFY
jgi:hypothetical protein